MSRPHPNARPSRPAAALVALVAALAAGCASSEPAPKPVTTKPAAGQQLQDMAEMQRARVHREEGERVLAKAYQVQDITQREAGFSVAMKEFRAAQDEYAAALGVALPRHKPLIEKEMDSVSRYMLQIQRDKAPPK